MILNIFLILFEIFLIKEIFSYKNKIKNYNINNNNENENENDSIFTLIYKFNITTFPNNTCEDCIPNKIKISSKNEIYINFPKYKINENTSSVTLAKLDINKNNFIPFPSEEKNTENDPKKKLYSVNSFEIYEDKLYALDQGNSSIENSTKIIVYNISENEPIYLNSYIFDNDFIKNCFLNDIVIDPNKNIAYISNGVNNFYNKINHDKNDDNNIFSSIIIVDLNDNESDYVKTYSILHNDSILFPDETYYLHVDGEAVNIENNKINKNNSEIEPLKIGINGIALTCDYSMLYFTPLSSRMIYAIKTEDIINKIEKNKNYNYNNIINSDNLNILSFYKNDSSDGIIASSNGLMYLSALEKNSIYIHPNLD